MPSVWRVVLLAAVLAPPGRAGWAADDGDLKVELHGYVQFDGRFYPGSGDGDAGTDSFLLRRVRASVQGSLGRHFEFTLTPDFGGGSATVQDAYMEVTISRALQVRAGKFKPPVALERLQSATNLALVERALTSGLSPNRDLGLQLQGELGAGVLTYAAGVFDGAPDGGSLDGDANDGKDVAARVFLSPFKAGRSVLKDLGVGLAGTTGTQAGGLPTYRTSGQRPFFTYRPDVTAAGTRTRITPQPAFYRGRLGLLSEYLRSRTAVRATDTGAAAQITLRAWHATATVSLTGERESYTGLEPRHPFDPQAGHWGALELAARVNGFAADEAAFAGGFADPSASARKALAWAVGLNWHLTRNVKQMVSFERSAFTGGAPAGADRAPESALFLRTQLVY